MNTQEAIDYLNRRLNKFCETEPQNVRKLERLVEEQKQIQEWEETTGRTYNRDGPK